MTLLDTNVVSELLRPQPAREVRIWMDTQALETLYLSAITVGELRAGITLMPSGQKRARLHERIEQEVLPTFARRILPFDVACTHAYAALLANVRKVGSGIQTADALIAATALANGFKIATRDESPFRAAGVTVINPWQFPIS